MSNTTADIPTAFCHLSLRGTITSDEVRELDHIFGAWGGDYGGISGVQSGVVTFVEPPLENVRDDHVEFLARLEVDMFWEFANGKHYVSLVDPIDQEVLAQGGQGAVEQVVHGIKYDAYLECDDAVRQTSDYANAGVRQVVELLRQNTSTPGRGALN